MTEDCLESGYYNRVIRKCREWADSSGFPGDPTSTGFIREILVSFLNREEFRSVAVDLITVVLFAEDMKDLAFDDRWVPEEAQAIEDLDDNMPTMSVYMMLYMQLSKAIGKNLASTISAPTTSPAASPDRAGSPAPTRPPLPHRRTQKWILRSPNRLTLLHMLLTSLATSIRQFNGLIASCLADDTIPFSTVRWNSAPACTSLFNGPLFRSCTLQECCIYLETHLEKTAGTSDLMRLNWPKYARFSKVKSLYVRSLMPRFRRTWKGSIVVRKWPMERFKTALLRIYSLCNILVFVTTARAPSVEERLVGYLSLKDEEINNGITDFGATDQLLDGLEKVWEGELLDAINCGGKEYGW